MEESPSAAPQRSGRRPLAITPAGVLGTLALLVVAGLCVRLGFWQLSRLEERRATNTAVAARLVSPPVTEASALADTVGLFYRAATLNGVYDGGMSIVLPGRSYRGVPGVHLLTPLRLAGRSDAVLINRGWVPSADAASIDVADFAITEQVSVHGLLLPFPDAGESLAQRRRPTTDEGFRRVWYTVDATALRNQYPYPLLPVLLQELPDEGTASRERPRYPTRLEPPPLDEGPHLGYALQWFSFGAIAIIGWLVMVLRSRTPPRVVAPLLLLLLTAAPATAQLRPLDPMDWRIFDGTTATAAVGVGVLSGQPAPLAGTRGTLVEAGMYSAAVRSGRMALAVGGTAMWRLVDEVPEAAPLTQVRAGTGAVRQDAGPAYASTLFRISPNSWPADVALRFGATIPTTSDESGLDRDRTDFFALIGARYRRGALTLRTEQGVGINGTVLPDYPQSDVWTYSFGGAVRHQQLQFAIDLVGRQDGHRRRVRGNEDQRELRAGVDIGTRRWIQLRYIRGFSDYSPSHGLRIAAGLRLDAPR